MTILCRRLRLMRWPGARRESDAARLRVRRDEIRVEVQTDRIDDATDALEKRVRVNHISEAVEALLRGMHP